MFNAVDFGARGDGAQRCDSALQGAIDAAAGSGGGTVILPAGTYLTGPLMLRSNTVLHLEAGATLLAATDMADFVSEDNRFASTENERCLSLISAFEQDNIAVTGLGTINGGGRVWWDAIRHDGRIRKGEPLPEDGPDLLAPHGRPHILGFFWCKNVLVRDVTLIDSPQWTVHPRYCQNVRVEGVRIINPDEGPNTDGINPDSCRNVHISNCFIDTGDDCVTIKSGKDEEGRRIGIPCENVTVTNCVMGRGHGGVTIGSEMSGGVRNVVVSNCVFDGTDNGLRIKTARGRGGVVEHVRATNIVMRNVGTGLQVNMFYAAKDRPEGVFAVDETTPTLREIRYSHITMDRVKRAAVIRGIEEMPVERFAVSDLSGSCVTGISCDTARRASFRGIMLDTDEGPVLNVSNSDEVEIERVDTTQPHPDTPVVKLKNVRGAAGAEPRD